MFAPCPPVSPSHLLPVRPSRSGTSSCRLRGEGRGGAGSRVNSLSARYPGRGGEGGAGRGPCVSPRPPPSEPVISNSDSRPVTSSCAAGEMYRYGLNNYSVGLGQRRPRREGPGGRGLLQTPGADWPLEVTTYTHTHTHTHTKWRPNPVLGTVWVPRLHLISAFGVADRFPEA